MLGPDLTFFVLYPLVPWIGVMAAGYAFGRLATLPSTRRDRLYIGIGAAVTAGFLLLRLGNWYGDPSPWTSQETWWRTALSFLNTTQVSRLAAVTADDTGSRRCGAAVARAAARPGGGDTADLWPGTTLLLAAARTAHPPWRSASPWRGMARSFPGSPEPADAARPATVTDSPWSMPSPPASSVLYPVCRWFAGVKRRHRAAWLDYL